MISAGFLSTFVRDPLMDALGLEAATRLASWIDAICPLNTAFSPWKGLLYVNPLLSLIQSGDVAVERCLQQEASLVSVGQGELGGAQANRSFIPSLIMPHVYTRMYHSLTPYVPFLFAAANSFAVAEVVTPFAFSRLSPSVREASLPWSR